MDLTPGNLKMDRPNVLTVKRTPQNPINEFIIRKLVGSGRFQIHLYILACVMNRELTRDSVTKFLPAQFP